ncbi:MAG: hypothetical protein ABH879_03345 [archaeon]
MPAKRHRKKEELDLGRLVLVVVLAIVLFFVLTSDRRNTAQLEDDRLRIVSALIKTSAGSAGFSGKAAMVQTNRINETLLGHLMNLPYPELKKELGITSDVCIYLEDEGGAVIEILEQTENVVRGRLLGCPPDRVNIVEE